TRASHQIDGAAGVASRLRARLRLGREFHHRVDGQHDAGNPRDAALVDRRDVVPQIVVVHAVDLPVDLIGTRSVEGAEAAHVVATLLCTMPVAFSVALTLALGTNAPDGSNTVPLMAPRKVCALALGP